MNIEEFRADMVQLVAALIPDIADDYRAYEPDPYSDDDTPSMRLTVGADASSWGYQTGDNSYTGGAYGFADWSVVAIYRDSDPEMVADEIIAGFPDDWELPKREWTEACELWERSSVADRVDLCRGARISIFAARRDEMPQDDCGALLELLRG